MTVEIREENAAPLCAMSMMVAFIGHLLWKAREPEYSA